MSLRSARLASPGKQGARTKKKLAVDPVEAETVRLIFRLFREGDGTTGPMGVKAIVSWLNERGYCTRKGARWGDGGLHKVLTCPTYKDKFHFNQVAAKTKMVQSDSEHVIVPVEVIIDPAAFDAVQASLKARNQRTSRRRVL